MNKERTRTINGIRGIISDIDRLTGSDEILDAAFSAYYKQYAGTVNMVIPSRVQSYIAGVGPGQRVIIRSEKKETLATYNVAIAKIL